MNMVFFFSFKFNEREKTKTKTKKKKKKEELRKSVEAEKKMGGESIWPAQFPKNSKCNAPSRPIKSGRNSSRWIEIWMTARTHH